jgi:hypothetical protein
LALKLKFICKNVRYLLVWFHFGKTIQFLKFLSRSHMNPFVSWVGGPLRLNPVNILYLLLLSWECSATNHSFLWLVNYIWVWSNLSRIYIYNYEAFLSKRFQGWECSSVVERLPSMYKALVLILNTVHTQTHENNVFTSRYLGRVGTLKSSLAFLCQVPCTGFLGSISPAFWFLISRAAREFVKILTDFSIWSLSCTNLL